MWIIFSASVQGSAASTSDSATGCERLGEILEPFAWWRGKHSAARSWARRCKKGGWTTVLSGAAISPDYPPPTFPASTGTSEAFPANPSPPLVQGEGRTIADTCGPSSLDTWTLFDQGECFLRTWRDTSHSVSVMCLQTWKDLVSDVRSASTQRRKSALRTAGTASSSSDWPTPSANEDAAGTPKGKMQKMLGNHPEIRGPLDLENNKPSGSHSVLNPQFVEALMGFPIGWTDCGR